MSEKVMPSEAKKIRGIEEIPYPINVHIHEEDRIGELPEPEVKEYEVTLTFGEEGESNHTTDKIVGTWKLIKIIPDLPQSINIHIYDEDKFLIFKKSDLTVAGLFYPEVTSPPYEEGPPRPEDRLYVSGRGQYVLNDKLKILIRGTPGKRVRIMLRYV